MSRWYRKVRAPALWLLALSGGALVFASVRWLAAVDPFARFLSGAYSEPLGSGVGSTMQDVDVTIRDGSDLVISFSAAEVTLRRDQQYMRLTIISDGKVYDEGREAAWFEAGIATYRGNQGLLEVAGAPRAGTEDWELRADRVFIDRGQKQMRAPGGMRGRYLDGDVTAATFVLNYADGTAEATDFEWEGPVAVDQEGRQEQRPVLISGERFESFTDPERQVFYTAEAIDEDTILRADVITRYVEEDVFIAEGNCEYRSPDAVLIAPKVVVYHKEKRAVITGGVYVLVKPEEDKGAPAAGPPLPPAEPELPEGIRQPPGAEQEQEQEEDTQERVRSTENLRQYPIVITCEKVEYFYQEGEKRAILTGSPKARQDLGEGAWREITAPLALYQEDEELLTLESSEGERDVRLTNSNGDDLTAKRVVISTVEGKEEYTAIEIKGTIMVPREESKGGGKGGGGGIPKAAAAHG
ncbi:MAG: hypothetical protein IH851_02475 [Armatimonadetes bacterium]|nr:hypothetical protein [Armatimonadota bacterium]